jgi:hypothetical protein
MEFFEKRVDVLKGAVSAMPYRFEAIFKPTQSILG